MIFLRHVRNFEALLQLDESKTKFSRKLNWDGHSGLVEWAQDL